MSVILDPRAEISELQEQSELLRRQIFDALRHLPVHATEQDKIYSKAALRDAREQLQKMRDKVARALRAMGDK